MNILVVYHFFHPDPVISARIFSELAVGLAKAGHAVSVFTGNRMIRGDGGKLAPGEKWHGVEIRRFSRPSFSQGNNFGRLLNSAILQLKWLWAFFRSRGKFDMVIVGTDPQFSYLMFPFLRLTSRRVKIVHWAFDLYPEAILANSPCWMKCLASLSRPLIPLAYRRVDVMVDLGSRMRERLSKYRHRAACETLTPWALVEPETLPMPDPEVRRELFGDAGLGILYSGTVGYAHDLAPFIALARECRHRGLDVVFCFAGYGNQYGAQTAGITPEDTNIRLIGFTAEKELGARLAAADIHLVSLRKGWEGIVVPSKFFGALAIGRPVIYSGSSSGDIGCWIDEYGVGWNLREEHLSEMAEVLRELIEDKDKLHELQCAAHDCYRDHFSREAVMKRWNDLVDANS